MGIKTFRTFRTFPHLMLDIRRASRDKRRHQFREERPQGSPQSQHVKRCRNPSVGPVCSFTRSFAAPPTARPRNRIQHGARESFGSPGPARRDSIWGRAHSAKHRRLRGWVPGRTGFNPNGVVSGFRRRAATPLGLFAFGHVSHEGYSTGRAVFINTLLQRGVFGRRRPQPFQRFPAR